MMRNPPCCRGCAASSTDAAALGYIHQQCRGPAVLLQPHPWRLRQDSSKHSAVKRDFEKNLFKG